MTYARRPKPTPIDNKTSYEHGAEARDQNSKVCPYENGTANSRQWHKGWNNRDFDIWFEAHTKVKT